MNKNQGKSCARCKAYLFEEDDVVYCPICGAPHHRECYSALGHCALEELHDTEKQYDKLSCECEDIANTQEKQDVIEDENEDENGEVVCKICGNQYPKSSPRCNNCGAPNFDKNQHFQGFDFYGGVPKTQELGEGVTAEDAAKFVNVNTPRYIPKFSAGKKVSFNWIAFLFPAPWFFARKMYKNGFIAGIFSLIASLFTNVSMENIFAILKLPDNYTQQEFALGLMEALPEISASVLVMMLLGGAISWAVMLITGVFGDYWYKNHVIEKVKIIKAQSEDVDTDYRKKGSVNFILGVAVHMCINYLTVIIMSFIY